MIKTKLGLYEKALHEQLSLEEKCSLAQKAGFAFLELSIDESEARLARLTWTKEQWQKLQNFLQKNNFAINSLCLSAHRKYALGSSDPNIRAQALAIFDQALVICQLLNIKIIQLAGYDVFYEPSTTQTQEWFLINLKLITQKAQKAGIYLGIETMDTPFLGTATKVRKYVDLVNSTFLQIYPDLGNLTQWSSNPILDVANNVSFFLQVHLKSTLPNVFRDLPWEAGNVDFVGLIKTLACHNYQKYFLAEMWAPKNQSYNYEQEMQRLQECYQFLGDKLRQGGYELC